MSNSVDDEEYSFNLQLQEALAESLRLLQFEALLNNQRQIDLSILAIQKDMDTMKIDLFFAQMLDAKERSTEFEECDHKQLQTAPKQLLEGLNLITDPILILDSGIQSPSASISNTKRRKAPSCGNPFDTELANTRSPPTNPTSSAKGKQVAAPTDRQVVPTIEHNNIEEYPILNPVPTCGICFEDINTDSTTFNLPNSSTQNPHGLYLDQCRHPYCQECLVQYITHSINNRTGSGIINCPLPNCDTRITPEHKVIDSLDQKTKLNFQDMYTKSLVDGIYCPSKNCSQYISIDIKELKAYAFFPICECPHCDFQFCFECRVQWHLGYSCEQYNGLPLDQRDPDDLELVKLAKGMNWRGCPSCNAIIDRVDGCNFIKCLCGVGFCYLCGAKYDLTKADVADQHGRPSCRCGLFDVPADNDGVGNVVPVPYRIPLYGGGAMIGLEDSLMKGLPKWLKQALNNRECHYCKRSFNTLRALDQHQSNTTAHDVFVCCGRTFLKEQHMFDHKLKKRCL